MNQGQSSASETRIKQENEQPTTFTDKFEYKIQYLRRTGKPETAWCDRDSLLSTAQRIEHGFDEFAGTTSAMIMRKNGKICYWKDPSRGTIIDINEFHTTPDTVFSPQLVTKLRTSAPVAEPVWTQALIPEDGRFHNPSLYLYPGDAADPYRLLAGPRTLEYTDLKGRKRTGHCDFETSLEISRILSNATVLDGSQASLTMRNLDGLEVGRREKLDEETVRRLDELWPSDSENPDFASIIDRDYWWDTGIEEEFQVRIKKESRE